MGEEKQSSSNKELLEKLLKFAVRTIELGGELTKSEKASIIVQPLITSGTAIGQYCQEAQEVLTRDDFINKVSQALGQARITQYLLKVIQYGKFADERGVEKLIAECNTIVAVLSRSVEAMRSRE